ncbi:MAG: NADP-dependent phosphogluconate dehydrogenase [Albidovulum sp.]|nr:NADP-dependent phosphogluconate dehydrogenase [Albidovulum sp.]
MSNADVGLIGLGTMGAMLSLNIAEKGFKIAVYNRTTRVTRDFFGAAGELAARIVPCETIEDLVANVTPPHAIILMVPAGDPVDQQISELSKFLDRSDLIVDAGNANFRDTNRRSRAARAGGIPFMGIGVSGGEEGARHGPSIMVGGAAESWQRMQPILSAIAAKHEGTPCATHMGPDGAGHFVKAVHNGIEYADMQIIAEAYGILRDGLSFDAEKCGAVFTNWNAGLLKSYLIEISGKVAAAFDPETGRAMLDIIEDKADQKGTGRWTAIEAQHLGAPITVIEAAVSARNMSALKHLRVDGEKHFGAAAQAIANDGITIADLESALVAGKIICYAQGFDLLDAAGREFDWSLPMAAIAETWREGCIIRSAMLNDMASALRSAPEGNLMFAPYFSELLKSHVPALRRVSSRALSAGHPVPALAAALSYFDSMRTARSTANMIQGQRDFFGAHGFERVDRDGAGFHGPWGSHG